MERKVLKHPSDEYRDPPPHHLVPGDWPYTRPRKKQMREIQIPVAFAIVYRPFEMEFLRSSYYPSSS